MRANSKTHKLTGRKATPIFYLSSLFNSLSSGIVGPLFIVYLLSIDLSLPQIGILFAIQRIAIIICGIPTGVFADHYGRKRSTMISFGLLSILSIGWFLTDNFFILLLLSFLGGLAYTFQSGAKEALMIDTLNLKKAKRRTHVFSRINIIGNIGLIVGGILAAAITTFSLRYIWVGNAILNLLLLILFYYLWEKRRQLTIPPLLRTALLTMLHKILETFRYSWKKISITILIGITLLVAIATAAFTFAYPVFFKESLHFPDRNFGFLGSASAIIGILGIWLGERLSKRFGLPLIIIIIALLSAVSFSIFGFAAGFVFALVLFLFIESLIHGWNPLFQSYLNTFIPDRTRAALLSLITTASLVGFAIGELGAGLVFRKVNFLIFMVAAGILFLIVPLGFYLLKKSLPRRRYRS